MICTSCHQDDGVTLPEIPMPKYRRNRTKAWNQAQCDARTRVISGLCMYWRCLDCPMPDDEDRLEAAGERPSTVSG